MDKSKRDGGKILWANKLDGSMMHSYELILLNKMKRKTYAAKTLGFLYYFT